MTKVRAIVPEWDDDEKHIVRRIGAAVVFQWSNLPDATRELILQQAQLVDDEFDTVQLEQQISAFIEKYQT